MKKFKDFLSKGKNKTWAIYSGAALALVVVVVAVLYSQGVLFSGWAGAYRTGPVPSRTINSGAATVAAPANLTCDIYKISSGASQKLAKDASVTPDDDLMASITVPSTFTSATFLFKNGYTQNKFSLTGVETFYFLYNSYVIQRVFNYSGAGTTKLVTPTFSNITLKTSGGLTASVILSVTCTPLQLNVS